MISDDEEASHIDCDKYQMQRVQLALLAGGNRCHNADVSWLRRNVLEIKFLQLAGVFHKYNILNSNLKC